MTPFDSHLARLQDAGLTPHLLTLQRGLEKESLRVNRDGSLARTPHPRGVGSALTHPHITTDYSEALMEFITPVYSDVEGPLAFLDQLHRYTHAHLGDELLWVNSMPCCLGREEDIPIAEYGPSHRGRFKHVYRHGLWHRYGRAMQCIAGIHYNVSLPDAFWPAYQDMLGQAVTPRAFISDRYFHLIRNFQRHVSLLIYLLGASPAVCASFLQGRRHSLKALAEHTLYAPFGTSLRMGNLGYHNDTQSALHVSYESLPAYIETLYRAASTPHPAYEALGIKVEGTYRQLNAHLLQLENEYYASIRPKHPVGADQRTLCALADGGVKYVEVRCLDLNPFMPLGIDADTLRFVDLFLLFCLVEDSPALTDVEYRCMHENQETIVLDGRNPAHCHSCRLGPVTFKPWARETLDKLASLASLLDGQLGASRYMPLVRDALDRLDHPELTPSAQLVDLMTASRRSFTDLTLEQSRTAARHFRERPLSDSEQAALAAEALDSLEAQARLDSTTEGCFDDYVNRFLAQTPRLAPDLLTDTRPAP